MTWVNAVANPMFIVSRESCNMNDPLDPNEKTRKKGILIS